MVSKSIAINSPTIKGSAIAVTEEIKRYLKSLFFFIQYDYYGQYQCNCSQHIEYGKNIFYLFEVFIPDSEASKVGNDNSPDKRVMNNRLRHCN